MNKLVGVGISWFAIASLLSVVRLCNLLKDLRAFLKEKKEEQESRDQAALEELLEEKSRQQISMQEKQFLGECPGCNGQHHCCG